MVGGDKGKTEEQRKAGCNHERSRSRRRHRRFRRNRRRQCALTLRRRRVQLAPATSFMVGKRTLDDQCRRGFPRPSPEYTLTHGGLIWKLHAMPTIVTLPNFAAAPSAATERPFKGWRDVRNGLKADISVADERASAYGARPGTRD